MILKFSEKFKAENLKESISIFNKFLSPENCFLLLALFFGIVFIFLTPPFQVADENSHFIKAYAISDFKIYGIIQDGRPGDYLPASLSFTTTKLMDGIPFHPDNKFNIDQLKEFFNYPLDPDINIFTPILLQYSPIQYLPQAMGIMIGRILSVSPLVLMYLGRLFNFIIWAILIYCALKIVPIAKWLFLLLALTPMSLFQAASLSSDAFINGLAFLLITLFLYFSLCDEKRSLSKWELLILILLSVFLSLSKQVYSFIPLLFLLIPLKKFSSRKDYVLKFCALIVPVICANILWSYSIRDMITIPLQGGVDSVSQILFILNNPLEYLHILFNTFFNLNNTSFTAFSFIGILGWADTVLPPYVYYCFFAMLFSAVFLNYGESVCLTFRQKVIIGLVLVLTILSISTAMFIVWNPVGQTWIHDLYGRYFIPISPLFFLIFYNNKKIKPENFSNWFKLILITILITILFISTYTIFTRYYSNPLPLIIPLILVTCIFFGQVIIFKIIEIRKQKEESKYGIPGLKTEKKLNFRQIFSILCIVIPIFSIILVILVGTGVSIGVSQPVAEQPVGEIIGGTTFGQTFYSPLPDLSSIDIELATWGRTNTKDVVFHLRDSPESSNDIVTIHVNAKDVTNNAFNTFKFPPIGNSANRSYYFFIESPESVSGNAITIWSSKNNTYTEGAEYINSKPVAGDLAFKVNYALQPKFF